MFSIKSISQISAHEHEFLQNRSKVTILITNTLFISKHLGKQEQIDVVYSDLTKLINFSKLTYPTEFHTFFYNGCRTNKYVVTLGVPHGLNRGPVSSLVLMNDLSRLTTPHCYTPTILTFMHV